MRRKSILLLAVLALVAAACDAGSELRPNTTAEPVPTTLGELPEYPEYDVRAGVITSLSSTNIWAVYGVRASVYDALVLQGQPAFLYTSVPPTFTQVPRLASDPEPPVGQAQGDVWVIDVALRDGITWSDGEPVDAGDVAFTFNTVSRLFLGGGFANLWPVASPDNIGPGLLSVEPIDEATVRFTWDHQPGIARWQHGVAYAPIMPEHFWAPIVEGFDRGEQLYGVDGTSAPSFGSMITAGHTPGESVLNISNPEHPFRGSSYTVYENGAVDFSHPVMGTGQFGGEGHGEAVLEFSEEFELAEMPVTLFVNRDEAADDLIDGQIGLWANPLPMWPDFGSLRRKFTVMGGITNADSDASTIFYLAFNTRRFPGNDVAFRQAIDCMLHKEFITDEYIAGAVENLDSVVPPTAGAWHDPTVASTCDGQSKGEKMASAVEILKNGGWTWEREPEFDPSGDAGFGDVRPGEGLRGPAGEVIDPIWMATAAAGYDPVRATYSLWVQVFVTELGVPVIAAPTDFHGHLDGVAGLDWDMYVGGWATGDSVPGHLVAMFHSSSDSARGGANTTGYASASFDELAERFLSASDESEARALAHEMQALISEEAPVVMLYTTDIHFSYRRSPESPFPDLVHVLNMGSWGLPGLLKRN